MVIFRKPPYSDILKQPSSQHVNPVLSPADGQELFPSVAKAFVVRPAMAEIALRLPWRSGRFTPLGELVNHRKTMENQRKMEVYPLVNLQKAIENGHRNI